MAGRLAVEPLGKKIASDPSKPLRDLLGEHGVHVESICGGRGTCGKCRVSVRTDSAAITEVTSAELKKLKPHELSSGLRLSCQIRIDGDAVISIPFETQMGKQRILVDGVQKPLTVDPLLRRLVIPTPRHTLGDHRSDLERFLAELHAAEGAQTFRVDLPALTRLPEIHRSKSDQTTVFLLDHEVLEVVPSAEAEAFGIAIDIGTTTLVAYLVDLQTGKTIATGSAMNPQIAYGDDVMSRATYAMEHPDGPEKLREAVIGGINEIIQEACRRAQVDPRQVYDIVAVGNTAMHHILLGIDLRHLCRAPYVATIKDSVRLKARELGVRANPGTSFELLPNIAGFVGADHVGVILSTEIYKEEPLTLALDIGTNGEIVLGNKETLSSTSVPAGPALEGYRTSCGMRATDGAIEKVEISPGSLQIRYETIADAPPRGICGSGMIDMLAELLRAGVLRSSGKIRNDLVHERIRKSARGREFVVVFASESATGQDLVMTDDDLSQLQLAKAAFFTGAYMLTRALEVPIDRIERILLAGAFGSHLNVRNAMTIGLYPEVPIEKVSFVGNAAGMGAVKALVSREGRRDAEWIRHHVRYLELVTQKDFQTVYARALFLPNLDRKLFPRISQEIDAGTAQLAPPVLAEAG